MKMLAPIVALAFIFPGPSTGQNILEPGVAAAGTALGEAIRHSRNASIGQSNQIPANIRERLQDFFPDEILDAAKYKVGDGGVLNLARNTLFNPNIGAVTLDDVIVFRSDEDARDNHLIWAHELRHVQQYSEWGVNSFATQYVRNAGRVESEAYAFQERVQRLTSPRPGCSTAREVVADLYVSLLERQPDEAGWRLHAILLNSGRHSVKTLVSALVVSEEHVTRFARNLPGEQQIQNLYRHVLARDGEAGGVAHNSGQLAQHGYQHVARGFVESQEYTVRFGDWTVPSKRALKFCS